MTATTMATYLPEQWSTLASITYRAETVLVPLLDHRWEPEIGVGQGDTVNVPNFTQNSSPNNRGAGAGTFGTGASITFDAVTEAQTQIAINRFYYKAFRIPAEMNAQKMAMYVPLLTDGIGQAIALQIDSDIASDNTNGIDAFSTTAGTDNVDITEDDLIEVMTNLNNANAPLDGRYLVVSPASYGSLLKVESLRNQLYAGSIGNLDGNKGQGYVGGPVFTFQVYMSNNLESGTSGKKNGAFQREAVAYASQKKVKMLKDVNIEDGVFDQYLGYEVCGWKEIKDGFGTELAGK